MNESPKADWKVITAIFLCGLVWMTFLSRQQANQAVAKKRAAAVAASNGSMALTTGIGGTPGASPVMVRGTGSAIAAATAKPVAPAVIVPLGNKVLKLELTSDGARPVKADLPAYHEMLDGTSTVQLVATSNEGIAPLQAWFGDLTSNKIDKDARWEKLAGEESKPAFQYTSPEGLTIKRTFSLVGEDDYGVLVTEELSNKGEKEITGHPGLVWSANLRGSAAVRSLGEFEPIAHVNGRVFRRNPPKPGERTWLVIPASEFEYRYSGAAEWIGVGDRYFVAAAVPVEPKFEGAPETVRLFHPGLNGAAGSSHSTAALAIGPEMKLAPGGAVQTLHYQLYLGPKDYVFLQKAGHDLGETIDWGYFLWSRISKGFWHVLHWLHDITGNWGVAIIALTFVIRGLLWPLAARQMRISQEFAQKSAKLKPQLDKVKEKYADDPMALNRETMLVYKQHGLSPFSPMLGCLPLLAQMPVFWALNRVLWTSIDLRQAPFALWIHDLSVADPGPFKILGHNAPVLPVLLGLVTFVQTKLTPQAPGQDPMQQKMMLYTMPVLFTAIMLSLPAGLVLYIFTSTVMGIVQQYIIRRKYPINAAPVVPSTAAKEEAT